MGLIPASDLSSVNKKLADLTSEWITAQMLGLTPNVQGAASSNFEKLVNAFNAGLSVVIDDTYYVEHGYNNREINNNIKMVGLSKDNTLKVMDDLFILKNGSEYIELDGVNFEYVGSGDNISILFYVPDAIQIKDVTVTNSSFEGNISLLRWNSIININPSENLWGLDTLHFKDNTVSNMHSSFIFLQDVPFTEYQVERNTIKNFDYVFLNVGITNEHSYPTQILEAMKKVVVKNNDVYCEDSWFGGDSSSSYFCFVLTETQQVIYHDNHVEGMKSTYDVALYDAYLSSVHVDYQRNTWKNNIVFNSEKTNNTLIKCKGNGGTRFYKDNRYIIEESYADKVGKSTDQLSVEFLSISSELEELILENNYVNVYRLQYPGSSIYVDKMEYINNTFITKFAKGIIFPYGFISDKDYRGYTLRFNNNYILNTGNYNESESVHVIRSGDSLSTGYYHGLEMMNNYISMTNLEYIFYETKAIKAKIYNNVFEIPYTAGVTYSGLYFNDNIKEKEEVNNRYTAYENNTFYIGRSPIFGKSTETKTVKAYIDNNSTYSQVICSLPLVSLSDHLKVKLELTIKNVSVSYKVNYSFELYYDSTVSANKLKFINTDSQEKIATIGTTEEKWAYMAASEPSGLYLRLVNMDNEAYIYINGLSNNQYILEVNTIIDIVE